MAKRSGLIFVSLIFLLVCLNQVFATPVGPDADADGIPDVFTGGQISAGGGTCVLDAKGVNCWGRNGSTSSDISSLQNPVAVSAGEFHTCALDDNGVHCWGDNSSGQTTVPALTNPTAVSAGGLLHTCALDDNGVHCWGNNSSGQTTVPALTNPTAVSAGGLHTCAIDAGGVKCWGDNYYGQTTVPDLSHPVVVSAGEFHTCAIDDSGVKCWGDNYYGQTTVSALTNPTAVSAGGSHTCALDDNGVHCWGDNSSGQTTVPALTNPTAVSAGGSHTCALEDSGVKCWGGTFSDQTTVPEPELDYPVAVSMGGNHACALGSAGVYCWNYSFFSSSGGSVPMPKLNHPVTVSSGDVHTCALDDSGVKCWGDNSSGRASVPALTHPTAVSAGGAHTCAIDDGGVKCWGYNYYGQTTVPVLTHPTVVSAGDLHTCVLDATGVHCWGDNSFGQTDVPALNQPTAVSAGYRHTCALDAIGVHCWGDNSYSQAKVPALQNPVEVSAGYKQTCALNGNGIVRCWGNGWAAQSALSRSVAVSAGRGGSCALDSTGVHCWGTGEYHVSRRPIFADNCPAVYNSDQRDTDGDGMGDACDDDLDGDGSLNNSDNDVDGDGAANTTDNCPLAFNPNQSDINQNGFGDACDIDIAGVLKADKAGSSVAFASDFNSDGYGDYVIGMPGYDLPADKALKIKAKKDIGRAVVISGKDGAELASIEGAAAKDAMGMAVAGGADIDNDGFDDVVVGAPNAGATHAGTVTVLYGRANNTNRSPAVINGAAPKSQFGAAVALGNVDGVAGAEVLVGAPKEASASGIKQAGSVSIYAGANLSRFNAVFYGATANAYAGTFIATGKLNDDGIAVLIGAPNDSISTAKNSGSVKAYLLANPTEPLFIQGGAKGSQFGKAIAVGKIDSDSYDDVLIGAPLDDDLGDKREKAGSITVFSSNSGAQLTKKYGANAKAQLGNSVALGDVNGDGKVDIIAGAWKDNQPTANLKKILKMTGSVSIWSGDGYAQIGTTKYGNVAKDYFGSSVSAGDINSDGKADIIIGIPGFDLPLPIAVNAKARLQKDAGKATVVSGAWL